MIHNNEGEGEIICIPDVLESSKVRVLGVNRGYNDPI
jgi:hypothetical protein